ncbi:three-Cys-motif partner protein TcmP [Cupriavidus necator]|uniref:three-Cys-motif partner protein TcmP n=1 Tax=Cupriavidus necator TaxID=106590 RepID=UPI0005B3BF69|nr:three-Cys-motif partner protein TcmP [Cupriavidus necator]
MTHVFGGEWTEQKLVALKKYLEAYRKIFTINEKARYFRTVYIDAFAGTGERSDKAPASEKPTLFDNTDIDAPQATGLHKGSARIALELESPFDQYVFIDKNPKHTAGLTEMIEHDFPNLRSRCRILTGDGVEIVREQLIYGHDWKRTRAVLFIDPYGMNIHWDLIQRIAATQAIDMWLLFPLGQGMNRLLSRDHLPNPGHSAKLTAVLGTDEWKTRFYSSQTQTDLFGIESESSLKTATFENMVEFLKERLSSVFAGVASDVMMLENSKGSPLYALCFAAANKAGAKTAIRIASDLLRTRL